MNLFVSTSTLPSTSTTLSPAFNGTGSLTANSSIVEESILPLGVWKFLSLTVLVLFLLPLIILCCWRSWPYMRKRLGCPRLERSSAESFRAQNRSAENENPRSDSVSRESMEMVEPSEICPVVHLVPPTPAKRLTSTPELTDDPNLLQVPSRRTSPRRQDSLKKSPTEASSSSGRSNPPKRCESPLSIIYNPIGRGETSSESDTYN